MLRGLPSPSKARRVVLTLPPTLTWAPAAACLRDLQGSLAKATSTGGAGGGGIGVTVVVDAGSLGQFDSSALAVLLALRREADGLGLTFAVTGMPQSLANLARLYGIAELLPGNR